MEHLHDSFFYTDEYLDEFENFYREVEWSDRNPLNTEMLFLWSMIRSLKPKLFIESGAFKGYSANFICEALARNDNDAEFVTYGFNLDNCIPFAQERLAKYPFARVVEGDSREAIRAFSGENRPTAFFIDGPKGRNLPPLLLTLKAQFSDVLFMAVHDCEKESGSRNRDVVQKFFGREYPIMFCDAAFQEQFAYLDKPLIGKSELVDWKPFYWNGVKRDSYGTETGYVLPVLGPIGTPITRALFGAERYTRFFLYAPIRMKIKTIFGQG